LCTASSCNDENIGKDEDSKPSIDVEDIIQIENILVDNEKI
jgi:hypothetical protein